MFAALGRLSVRARRWVVAGALVLVIAGGVWGSGTLRSLTGGAGFDDPTSESSRADELLAGPLGRHVADIVVLYRSDHLTVGDTAFSGPAQQALASVPPAAVTRMDSYWSTHDDSYVSHDRRATYIAIQLPSNDEQGRVRQFIQIKDRFKAPGLEVRYGGLTAMTQQVNAQVGGDIVRAEAISIPVLLILLVLIFRSAVAAALPFVVGTVGSVGSLAVLRVVTSFVSLSTFAIEVIVILGLGLAIDYALLIVDRFRTELAAGTSVDDAVSRTMATAGRTVTVSGATVALSFAGLTVFPSRFLLSMGYAGAVTALVVVVVNLVLVPALLGFVGQRINKLQVPLLSLETFGTRGGKSQGVWYRVARTAMRRPLATTIGITVFLICLGLPFIGVNWARPGDWVLPPGADARVVTQQLATQFEADPSKVLTVVVKMPSSVQTTESAAALDAYGQRLERVRGVSSVALSGTYGDLARFSLVYSLDPQSPAANQMVHDLRARQVPYGATAFATGMPASRVDIVSMIGSRLPWMALFVAAVCCVVLFIGFGSVVLPLKSVLMNLLSLSAAFGAIKLIFQDGHLAGLLNFVPVGAVDADFPVLIVAIAFALSTDYEVFLLSRVREEWTRTGNHAESVATGVQLTARIITSAALLLIAVVVGYVLSQITLMKMIGVGLIIAVVVDAFIVRTLLFPAIMGALGERAWWAPRLLALWWRKHHSGVDSGDQIISLA